MAGSNKKLFAKYVDKMNSLNKDKNIEAIYDSLLNGKNSYLRYTRRGSSSFDPSWISVIEDCLYDLGEIINNPREVTKTDSHVTPIELAKKIDGESVQHLASHTQYIKEVDENGNVIPSKILSHSHIEDIHTYENRFIATFIRQLMLFVEKRYSFISSNINLTKDDTLMVKNKTIVDGQEVEIETKITIRKEENDKSAVEAKDYISRILNMREYIQYYYNSPFMKQMKNERDVRRPILQTNIIKKNPKYRKCYETYLFIEKFDTLGVSYHVDENYQTYTDKEREEINYLMLSSFLSVQTDHEFESIKKSNKTYKPKILTSIDDEQFVYGDILKGPIEFIRIDETYREYLRSKVNPNLPLHPNKYEKEYYQEEYDYKKEQKMDEKQLDRLIARKQKEIAEYEKYIEKLIEQREFEEAEQRKRELEALRAYENALIELRRKKIIEAAEANKIPYDPSEMVKEEEKVEEVINEPLLEETALNEPLNNVIDETPVVPDVVESIPEVVETSIEPVEDEAPVAEEPVIVASEPQEDNPNEVYVEVPQEEATPETQEAVEAPIQEETVGEEEPSEVQPENDNSPVEEETPEEFVARDNEIVYHVIGESEIVYVDGHKEERIIVESDENEESPIEEQNEIPGEYIVKCDKGYFVDDDVFSHFKKDAKVFKDFNIATQKKALFGGKVIKL